MQKQKLTDTLFLTIQATYTAFEIGLFHNATCIDTVKEDKILASKDFIKVLESLLCRNNTSVKDLDCVVVNQGPGLFSVLRSILTFANGLNFATGLPLVGVDGITAFLYEHTHSDLPVTVALLNAFNNDVYFGIKCSDRTLTTGYNTITHVLAMIDKEYHKQPIHFIGNGVELYRADIIAQFSDYAHIPDNLADMVSIEQIGRMGLERWHAHETSDQLLPLYLKQHPAQASLKKNVADSSTPV
jgi:tRNA threonylcarbamoyl adenosine modification protein YeaZ